MNILVSCNDNYLMPLEVTLFSFFESNPSTVPHHVYLLYSSLSATANRKLEELVLAHGGIYHGIKVNSSVFEKANTNDYISKEAYFRLLSADILPKEISRILWLDADILVRKPLDDLYEIDLEGYWAAACSYGPSMLPTMIRHAETLKLSNPGGYFNTGVMLYDLDACRKADVSSKSLALLTGDRFFKFVDQDLANIVFEGHVKIVDYRIWNSMSHCIANKEDLDYAKDNAAVIHFPGRAKPWHFNDIHFADEWASAHRRLFGSETGLNRVSYFKIKSIFSEKGQEKGPEIPAEIKVSVIIPAFNASSTLPRCLDGIIPQLDDSMELIVVDDGSSDDSFNLLKERYANIRQLIAVRTSKNCGVAAARNNGLRLARGKMIAFCDADDEWLPGKLAEQVAALDEDPEADIAFIQDKNVSDDITSGSKRILDLSLKDNTFIFRTCLARKSLFDRVGLLDESLRVREDIEWIVRAVSSGAKYKVVEKELSLRHVKSSGLSVQALQEKERGNKRLAAFMLGIRRKCFVNPPLYDLSILIPCLNSAHYLEDALLSCGSTYSTEIIVVDDGSSDDSVRMANDIMRKHSIRGTVVSRGHRGQAASRNDALAVARGRWIMYLDADDRFVPGALDKAMKLAESADESTFLLSFLSKDFISPELTPEQASKLIVKQEPYRRMLAGCMLCRRTLYERVGAFDETLTSSETAGWVIKVRESGLGIQESDLVTLERRYHLNNFGRQSREVQMRNYISIIRSRMK